MIPRFLDSSFRNLGFPNWRGLKSNIEINGGVPAEWFCACCGQRRGRRNWRASWYWSAYPGRAWTAHRIAGERGWFRWGIHSGLSRRWLWHCSSAGEHAICSRPTLITPSWSIAEERRIRDKFVRVWGLGFLWGRLDSSRVKTPLIL